MKKWLTNVGLVLLGGLVALLLAEVLLRVTKLASPDQGVFTVSERDFARIPGIWEPRQSQVVRDKQALPYDVTTNDLGYRGPDFALQKPPGEVRILFVGDSGTFGSYVDDDETLPARLQAHLASVCGSVRVVNAGLPGSTITEQRHLIERGLVTNPDLVILQFSENDVVDLAAAPMWDQLAENRRAKSRFPLGLVYPMVRRTALWGMILRARAIVANRATMARLESEEPRTGNSDDDTPSVVHRLRERYTALLGELLASLGPGSPPVVLVAYPSHHTLYGARSADQLDWVTRTAEGFGLPSLDLTPPLAATGEGERELYLLPHDGHPSPRAYDVAAEYLAAFLAQAPSLDPLCSPASRP